MSDKLYAGEYPYDWPHIAYEAKSRAGWKCEHCGAEFSPSGKAKNEVNRDGKPVILTVHHLDGNRGNNEHSNLLVVCQRCHLHVQAVWRPGGELPASWREVPGWLVERGLPYSPSRQMLLF